MSVTTARCSAGDSFDLVGAAICHPTDLECIDFIDHFCQVVGPSLQIPQLVTSNPGGALLGPKCLQAPQGVIPNLLPHFPQLLQPVI
jgi:hypothetical protein